MRESDHTARSKIFGSLFSKVERNNDYEPVHPSAEANICLTCTAKKCKGTCERLRTERKKIKEQQ